MCVCVYVCICCCSATKSGEGNSTPLQYSCLENPMDKGSLVGCSPWGPKESDMTERLHFHFSLSCIGEGNGNPLQCSCLENPRDGGAWWAAVYGAAQSQTRLKWLSKSHPTHCNPMHARVPYPSLHWRKHIFFFSFSSLISYCKILSIVPCAV